MMCDTKDWCPLTDARDGHAWGQCATAWRWGSACRRTGANEAWVCVHLVGSFSCLFSSLLSFKDLSLEWFCESVYPVLSECSGEHVTEMCFSSSRILRIHWKIHTPVTTSTRLSLSSFFRANSCKVKWKRFAKGRCPLCDGVCTMFTNFTLFLSDFEPLCIPARSGSRIVVKWSTVWCLESTIWTLYCRRPQSIVTVCWLQLQRIFAIGWSKFAKLRRSIAYWTFVILTWRTSVSLRSVGCLHWTMTEWRPL